MKDYEDALRLLERFYKISDTTDKQNLAFEMAINYKSLRQRSKAIKTMEESVYVEELAPAAWEILGDWYTEKGRLIKAIKCYSSSMEALSDTSLSGKMGRTYFKKGDYKNVKESLLSYLRHEPGTYEDWSMLATACLKTNDSTLALEACRKCTIFRPEEPTVWVSLGETCQQLGRFRDAISALEKAASMEPNSEYIHFKLGSLYAEQGKAHLVKQQISKLKSLRSNLAEKLAKMPIGTGR